MRRLIARALVAGLVGAVAGTASLVVLTARRPAQVFEMDRDLPSVATGFYPAERNGDETWVWTARRAHVRFAGLDRDVEWQCTVRLRAGRSPGIPLPRVDLAIDGVTRASVESTNDYQDVEVTAPATPRRGLSFGVFSSATFVSGPGDSRELGLMVDRLECRPASGGFVWPPGRAVASTAIAAGGLGVAFALGGLSLLGAAGAAAALALVQAAALTLGSAAFSGYPTRMAWLALWVGLGAAALSRLIEWRGHRPLHPAARLAVVLSAGAVYAKLLGLLHPSKPIVDALYHAHRLDWVLSGRLYFTQVMPDDVEFPYAIALYIVAAPFSLLTDDLMALLKILVSVAEGIAGGLLYVAVVRTWSDRSAGLLAVLLFHLAPIAYLVLGYANQTNAFGQSAALAAVAAAVVLPLGRSYGSLVGLTSLTTIALLSHVSTFGLTMATLVCVAVLYRAVGRRELRAPARSVLVATCVAAVLSVGLYWGHFTDTYRTLASVRAETAATELPAPDSPGEPSSSIEEGGPSGAPLVSRLGSALARGNVDFGWPLLMLAGLGAWRVWRDRRRDRLGLALGAWATTYGLFLAVAVLAPVSEGYDRYAAEFVSRVDLAMYPAVAVLGAVGALGAWRRGGVGRVAAVGLVVAALVRASQHWMAWLT